MSAKLPNPFMHRDEKGKAAPAKSKVAQKMRGDSGSEKRNEKHLPNPFKHEEKKGAAKKGHKKPLSSHQKKAMERHEKSEAKSTASKLPKNKL